MKELLIPEGQGAMTERLGLAAHHLGDATRLAGPETRHDGDETAVVGIYLVQGAGELRLPGRAGGLRGLAPSLAAADHAEEEDRSGVARLAPRRRHPARFRPWRTALTGFAKRE